MNRTLGTLLLATTLYAQAPQGAFDIRHVRGGKTIYTLHVSSQAPLSQPTVEPSREGDTYLLRVVKGGRPVYEFFSMFHPDGSEVDMCSYGHRDQLPQPDRFFHSVKPWPRECTTQEREELGLRIKGALAAQKRPLPK